MRPHTFFIGKLLVAPVVIAAILTLAACAASTAALSPEPIETPSNNISLTAQGFAFDKKTLTVNAGAAITIAFQNRDAVLHNVAVYRTRQANEVIFKGDFIPTGESTTYRFTAPTTPGTYYFRCDLHGSMEGSFIAR